MIRGKGGGQQGEKESPGVIFITEGKEMLQ